MKNQLTNRFLEGNRLINRFLTENQLRKSINKEIRFFKTTMLDSQNSKLMKNTFF